MLFRSLRGNAAEIFLNTKTQLTRVHYGDKIFKEWDKIVPKWQVLGSFAWRCFVDCFIHENGNDNAVVTALWRVCDSADDAEPMCALSRRQSWPGEERALAGLEASPSLQLEALSRRGPSPREKSLARLRQAWGASPGLESLVLSEIS